MARTAKARTGPVKCDQCGRKRYSVISSYARTGGRRVQRIDLCHECHAELSAWMEHEAQRAFLTAFPGRGHYDA